MSRLWTKALDAAEDARLLFRSERYGGACNRAYFAMFNAARALLVTRNISLGEIKRHATVLRLFSQHFVDGGPFDAELGRALRRASDTRMMADYEEAAVQAEEAGRILDAMDRFMTIAASIQSQVRDR